MSAGAGTAEVEPAPMEFRTEADDEYVYGNGLLFGPPKTGKSNGAHTAPGRVLYLNFETSKNATIYARQQAKARGVLGNIQEPKIPRWKKDTTPIWDMMVEVGRGAWADEPRWDSIVVDPISEMYVRLLAEQSERARRPTMDQRANAWADLERWIKSLVEAPVHLIVVAHEMQAQQGEQLKSFASVGSQTASIQGFGPKLMGLVDFIAFSGVIEVEGQDKPQFVAQMRPGQGPDGSNRPAGSRFDVLMDEAVRTVDLTEWFKQAGLYVPKAAQPIKEAA